MSTDRKYDRKHMEGLAKMLKGGVIMDVSNVEQARIAEEAGACAVMALERIPADMRKSGQVCRMSDPYMIKQIQDVSSIPVMAKVRIGHQTEAQILQSLGIDYIDESEVLTTANPIYHIDKNKFSLPFVCGAKNLGEALRRIQEGASMIRSKGEAGTGDVSEAVRHVIQIKEEIESAKNNPDLDLEAYASELRVSPDLLKKTLDLGRLPVVMFAAGGVATPADAALLMQLGCDGVFVGSGIFKSEEPLGLAKAIVSATTHYDDPEKLLEVSTNLGDLMVGTVVNPQ